MSKKKRTKLVHEGCYVAEVELLDLKDGLPTYPKMRIASRCKAGPP